MGHYESSRIDWDEEEKGCKSKKSKDGKHNFKETSYGIKRCQNGRCKKTVFTT